MTKDINIQRHKFWQEVLATVAIIAAWLLLPIVFHSSDKLTLAFAGLSGLVFLVYRAPSLLGTSNPMPNSLSPSLIASMVLLAWANRFIQDDAFISFRYAANLIHGYGLTRNHGGVPIEGYTNFLWTLLMALPIAAGRDPVFFSFILGIACFLCSLFATHRLALLLTGSARVATLAVLALGTNYTFSSYATGGLETQLQTALLTVAAFMSCDIVFSGHWAPSRLTALSLCSAAAVLTRPDSVLPLAVLYIWLLQHILVSRKTGKEKTVHAAAMLAPAVLIGLAYAGWKLTFYGDLLPNTFYLKATGIGEPARGARYVWSFISGYGYIFLLPLLAVMFIKRESKTPGYMMLSCIVLLWLAYVVKVGGCFMEFRLMVPILPLVVVLVFSAAAIIFPLRIRIQAAILVFLISMSFVHQRTFEGTSEVESIRWLNTNLSTARWNQMGLVLGRIFEGNKDDVSIATYAAGAIPFYSDLKTIDLLGLNDAYVARNGTRFFAKSGHQRIANLRYLLETKVNLYVDPRHIHKTGAQPVSYAPRNRIVTVEESIKETMYIRAVLAENVRLLYLLPLPAPTVESEEIRTSAFIMACDDGDAFPAGSGVIEIPLDHDIVIHLLYLTRHPAIDRVIKDHGLRILPIERIQQRTPKERT